MLPCSTLTVYRAAAGFVSRWHLDLPAASDSQIKNNEYVLTNIVLVRSLLDTFSNVAF